MFRKEINMENREEMKKFLSKHYRYNTANSWNRQTSYANNMKIYNLKIPEETKSKLYELLDVEEAHWRLNDLVEDFNMNNSYEWQAKWNGRSGGYLVLYSGGRKKLEYKSRCMACGQLNYSSTQETGCKCGRCGKETRIDLKHPIYEPYVRWRGIDQDENFDFWSDDELRKRVKVVMDFDQLCDDIVAEAAHLAEEYEVVEEIYYVEQTRKALFQRVS